jgi:hypothetical protein
MKYLILALIFVGFSSSVFAQFHEMDAEKKISIENQTEFIPILDDSFELKYQEHVRFSEENTAIYFLTVVDDSRCPSDVTCTWEGKSTLMFDVINDQGNMTLSIDNNNSVKVFDKYKIELIDVKPNPISTKTINLDDYIAVLKVTNDYIVENLEISPLKQFKTGIEIDKIKCSDFLILVTKYNNSPACVKPQTAETLDARGWIENSSVDNFEECVLSGNPVIESYPRQCKTVDGKNFVEEIDSKINSELICQEFDGKWIKEFNECEAISPDQCSNMNGTFKECESACRNDPTAEVCTLQCVQVCLIS